MPAAVLTGLPPPLPNPNPDPSSGKSNSETPSGIPTTIPFALGISGTARALLDIGENLIGLVGRLGARGEGTGTLRFEAEGGVGDFRTRGEAGSTASPECDEAIDSRRWRD